MGGTGAAQLVILVEEGEALEAKAFTHLVAAASQAREARVPVCLVVGFATTPDLITWPASVQGRLLLTTFRLESPVRAMDHLLHRTQVRSLGMLWTDI